MIKFKKKNPEIKDIYSIQNLKKLSFDNQLNRIANLISTINYWIAGDLVMKNKTPDHIEDDFLSIKIALQPYISKENKIIYRSIVGLSRDEYGYYSVIDLDKGYFQTGLKSLQNWTYSLSFAKKWGNATFKSFKIIFQARTSKNYNNIVIDPKSILIYFSKILKLFPQVYNHHYKKINHIIRYFNSDVQELLLYSPNGDLYIDKIIDIEGY